MAKEIALDDPKAALRASAMVLANFRRELLNAIAGSGEALSLPEAEQVSGYPSFAVLLVLGDVDDVAPDEKAYAKLLGRFGADTPGNLRAYPMLSQSALFDMLGDIGPSRETIRRLLLRLSQFGLIDRESKGPPHPDRLQISKSGKKLLNKVGKSVLKEFGKGKPHAYLEG